MQVKKFVVYGKVQGVGFRYFTWRVATKLGVVGWVKNLSEGSVLVIAKGEKEQIERLYELLQKGSSSSEVKQILCEDYPDKETFDKFSVRRD